MEKGGARGVEVYLATQPARARAALRRVRAALRAALPGAEEIVSYGMPAYRLHGRIVVYLAGWKEHLSVYPAIGAVAEALATELAPYRASKGTLRFPLAEPVPVRLIARFAKGRAGEIAKKAKGRATAAGARRMRAGAMRRSLRAERRQPVRLGLVRLLT